MDFEANKQGADGASEAALSRQLAAAKIVTKETARRLEIAASDLAVAQAVRLRCVKGCSLGSPLSFACRFVELCVFPSSHKFVL